MGWSLESFLNVHLNIYSVPVYTLVQKFSLVQNPEFLVIWIDPVTRVNRKFTLFWLDNHETPQQHKHIIIRNDQTDQLVDNHCSDTGRNNYTDFRYLVPTQTNRYNGSGFRSSSVIIFIVNRVYRVVASALTHKCS